MEKQQYQSPRIKVVEVKHKQVLCASPTGTFSLGNSTVGAGGEEDWNDTTLDW